LGLSMEMPSGRLERRPKHERFSTMTRIRSRYHSPGLGIWSGLREGLRWLMRLPLRLLRRRDHRQLRMAMEQLSPKLLSEEARIYWIYPPTGADPYALGGMREPTTGALDRLPATHRYLVLDLREGAAATYELPDRERFHSRRFPIPSGILPVAEAVRGLFRELVALTEEREELPPAILVHCKEGVSRTPQILCAWLVWRESLAPEEAVRRVQEAQAAADAYVFVPDGRERGWLREFVE
jgi:hypothetical protein